MTEEQYKLWANLNYYLDMDENACCEYVKGISGDPQIILDLLAKVWQAGVDAGIGSEEDEQ